VLRVIAVQCKHAIQVIFGEFFEEYAAGFEHGMLGFGSDKNSTGRPKSRPVLTPRKVNLFGEGNGTEVILSAGGYHHPSNGFVDIAIAGIEFDCVSTWF